MDGREEAATHHAGTVSEKDEAANRCTSGAPINKPPLDFHQYQDRDLNTLSREELVRYASFLRSTSRTLGEEETVVATGGRQITRKNKKKKLKERPFDFSRYATRQIAIKVSYLGWQYSGLEAQEETPNTISEKIFEALEKLKLIENRDKCNYSMSGRTDKGVSALGQVLSMRVRSALSQEEIAKDQSSGVEQKCKELDYVRLLNNVLPQEIRVLAWASVPDEFSARFDCTHRAYRFFFVRGNLNIELMHTAAQQLVGQHDFRNFCKIAPNQAKQLKRTITEFEIRRSNLVLQSPAECEDRAVYEMYIRGPGFLWHQVRCMAAVLFHVGTGQEKPEIISRLLDVEANPCKPDYIMASELPLMLCECGYKDLTWRTVEASTISMLERSIYDQWLNSALKTTLFGSMMQEIQETIVDSKNPQKWKDIRRQVSLEDKKHHVPLMQRQRGMTVEEKVAKKRRRKEGEEQQQLPTKD